MQRTSDLDAALTFVIGRIEEQAKQSGKPLSHEQRLLLDHLPSSVPDNAFWFAEDGPPPLVPRNVDYELLCELGKAARLIDVQFNPTSLDWDFAFAVFQLNHHPMWGLLQQAGVKYRRPSWDKLLLVFTALLSVVATIALPFLAGDQSSTLFQWPLVASGSGVVLLLGYLASRHTEKRQLSKRIERCRLASHFVNTIAG